MSENRYDVVVYGATSFVGQILVRYLSEAYGVDGELKWAAAGRSQRKLESVREGLGERAAKLPLIVADAADEQALEQMCAQTRVVISTVGPYALYGEPLVRVCARGGTDYCDLTGEVQWIRRMITRYEADARNSGARLVHCCGFDSIPSDMGVHFLQQQMQARHGAPASRVKMRVRAMRGGMSGGTVASLMNVMREASADKDLRRELADPYSLCPPDHDFSVKQPSVQSSQYDSDFGAWLAPFVMAPINTRVVLRSHALAGAPWGADFRYDEAMLTGRGVKGRLAAFSVSASSTLFMLAAALRPTRWVLERFVVPKPGEGPSPQAQEQGFYDLRLLGKTADGKTLRAKVTGDRDPGYGSTAKMLGQAGACLAQDLGKKDLAGGFWTPSTALGDALRERLTGHAGLTFEILD